MPQVFADDPPPPSLPERALAGTLAYQLNIAAKGGDNVGAPAVPNGNTRPDAESFVFTDVSAFVYKEWGVIKKNKFGRKQPRVLGRYHYYYYSYA